MILAQSFYRRSFLRQRLLSCVTEIIRNHSRNWYNATRQIFHTYGMLVLFKRTRINYRSVHTKICRILNQLSVYYPKTCRTVHGLAVRINICNNLTRPPTRRKTLETWHSCHCHLLQSLQFCLFTWLNIQASSPHNWPIYVFFDLSLVG